MTTAYKHTKEVYDILTENLKKEEARYIKLLDVEREVALQIEDATRVILALKRSLSTLGSGIPQTELAPAEMPEPTSMREMLHNAAEADRRANMQFSDFPAKTYDDEDVERKHDEAMAAAQE